MAATHCPELLSESLCVRLIKGYPTVALEWRVFAWVCVCWVCSAQLGLCSHGDGCERLWESNLQEVIATGWSICGMRIAPEGHGVDVQLAICCCPAARARKPPQKPHRKNRIFKRPAPGTAPAFPWELLGTSRTLSLQTLLVGAPRKHPKQNDDSMQCICCCAEWEKQRGSGHSMAHSSAKDHYLSSSWAKSSGYSTPFQTGSPLPHRITGGLPKVWAKLLAFRW